MPGKSVRFTHRFRGRVFGIEIDHLGKVYWFWDKYSPLIRAPNLNRVKKIQTRSILFLLTSDCIWIFGKL